MKPIIYPDLCEEESVRETEKQQRKTIQLLCWIIDLFWPNHSWRLLQRITNCIFFPRSSISDVVVHFSLWSVGFSFCRLFLPIVVVVAAASAAESVWHSDYILLTHVIDPSVCWSMKFLFKNPPPPQKKINYVIIVQVVQMVHSPGDSMLGPTAWWSNGGAVLSKGSNVT